MAIKIDCLKCSKRISIDEAFAGGVCRCPYCRAINNVPGRRGPKAFFPRPVAPPDETAGMRQAATHAEVAPEDIPMADRVVFQGIATIILMLMLLTLVVAGVAVVITSVTGNKPNGPNGGPGPDVQPNPFLASKPQTVAGKGVYSSAMSTASSTRPSRISCHRFWTGIPVGQEASQGAR